ncbi:MAG: VOC family protein, partial [Candidatus Binataceae bacterium]
QRRRTMELAKPCIDVGLFTNRLDEMRTFWGEKLRLPFEEILALGGGVKQHRFGLLGSVLKINHARDPLPPRVAGGYKKITFADPRTPLSVALKDPDGNDVELVPYGQRDIQQFEIHITVTDEAAFERFYGESLGGERLSPSRFRIGQTIVSFGKDRDARRADKTPPSSAQDVVGTMVAVGFRYITIQVRDCGKEYERLKSLGVWEGAPPVTLGEVARIAFVRDPDGNWIEISQRASLTGALPK